MKLFDPGKIGCVEAKIQIIMLMGQMVPVVERFVMIGQKKSSRRDASPLAAGRVQQ